MNSTLRTVLLSNGLDLEEMPSYSATNPHLSYLTLSQYFYQTLTSFKANVTVDKILHMPKIGLVVNG